MKAKLFKNKISVKPSQIHNYGVFADKNIKKGEIIEECPILLLDHQHRLLHNYTFKGDAGDYLLMGYGTLYNHANRFNADYVHYQDTDYMTFIASRFIAKGEEIFIDYGASWFTDRDLACKEITPRLHLINNPITLSLSRLTLICGLLYGGFWTMLHSYEPWRAFMASIGFMDYIK